MNERPVDREHIAEQMTVLGLSERTVVSRSGLSYVGFRKMRIQGLADGHTRLRQIDDLATVLDTTTSRLLQTRTTIEHSASSRSPEPVVDDAAIVIPILVGAGRNVEVGALAYVLGWDTRRTEAALRDLPRALAGTGFCASRSPGMAGVRAEASVGTLAATIAKLKSKTTGLRSTEARLLFAFLENAGNRPKNESNATRVAAGMLKNAGLIKLDERANLQVTEDFLAAFPDLS